MMAMIAHWKSDKAYRARVDDDHRIGMGLLGQEAKMAEESDVGDSFSVTGDQVHNHYAQTSTTSKLPALAALLGGAGLGAAAVAWGLSGSPTELPESIDTNTQYEFTLGFPDE